MNEKQKLLLDKIEILEKKLQRKIKEYHELCNELDKQNRKDESESPALFDENENPLHSMRGFIGKDEVI